MLPALEPQREFKARGAVTRVAGIAQVLGFFGTSMTAQESDEEGKSKRAESNALK
jgi:hypothetical protein